MSNAIKSVVQNIVVLSVEGRLFKTISNAIGLFL